MVEYCPSHIGRYELHGKIGSGAMGTVYKGVDPGIGRPVAIKLVRADLCASLDENEYLDRFHQEVKAAGRCVHPGIVSIFDCGDWEGRPYLVMEYLQGQPLQHMIARGPLPQAQAIAFAIQLLEALKVAHAHGVVHRDIKPANIIVTEEYRLKITDFGLALLDAEPLAGQETLVGTPSFMAPEQVRGQAVDHRADLFSVGVVLFRMLTGGSPYGDETFAAILKKVASTDRIDVSAIEAVSPLLASIVALALQKDVSDRFQSAQEFAYSLKSTLEANPVVLDTPPANAVVEDENAGSERSKAAGGVMPEELKNQYLEQMRPLLASSLGPIADRVFADAVKQCCSAQALTDLLARHFTENSEEQAFRIAAGNLIRQQAAPSSGPDASPPDGEKPSMPAEVLDGAQRLLASYIGPVSSIVIRQSLFDLTNGEEFANRLATHIGVEAEREAFRDGLRELMAIHSVEEVQP